MAQGEMAELEQDLEELEKYRVELSDYFCEDQTAFKLEECLKIFSSFCDKFNKAMQVHGLFIDQNCAIYIYGYR